MLMSTGQCYGNCENWQKPRWIAVIHQIRQSIFTAELKVGIGPPHDTLVTDCPTRWGSQHKMIS